MDQRWLSYRPMKNQGSRCSTCNLWDLLTSGSCQVLRVQSIHSGRRTEPTSHSSATANCKKWPSRVAHHKPLPTFGLRAVEAGDAATSSSMNQMLEARCGALIQMAQAQPLLPTTSLMVRTNRTVGQCFCRTATTSCSGLATSAAPKMTGLAAFMPAHLMEKSESL